MSTIDLREDVISCARGGDDLADIERRLIDPASLGEDEKAALWLVAWCYASDGNPWCGLSRSK